jgi:Domain of unknown function (DUF4430)
MRRTIVLVLTGTAVGAAALAQEGALAAKQRTATSGPAVTIRIEGLRKTLVLPKQVRTRSGSITKYGAPNGKCPARSAQGALDVATHGHWKGTWSSQFSEYFITSILGENPSGHDFWEIFVNNKAASKGACDLKLKAGEQILFADTDGSHNASALHAPASHAVGSPFTVRLLGYSKTGSKPLTGVRITGNGISPVKTNGHGVAKVTSRHRGNLVLRASPQGYIRTEAVVHVTR